MSTTIGTIGALNQKKIKRLLAYSRINNIGIIILGIYTHTLLRIQGSITHLITYTTRTIIILLLLHYNKTRKNLINEITRYNKTIETSKIRLSLILLSLIGLPPLPGFLRKWLIISSTLNKNLILISIWILITSIPATIYYLYIIINNFFKKWINNKTLQNNTLIISRKFYKISRILYPATTITIHPHLLLIFSWNTASTIINVPTFFKNTYTKYPISLYTQEKTIFKKD